MWEGLGLQSPSLGRQSGLDCLSFLCRPIWLEVGCSGTSFGADPGIGLASGAVRSLLVFGGSPSSPLGPVACLTLGGADRPSCVCTGSAARLCPRVATERLPFALVKAPETCSGPLLVP